MARMVPIKTCLSLPEALVVRSYLVDHGLTTALNGYHHASADWSVLFALNGIRLSVLDIEADRARELLLAGSPEPVGAPISPTLSEMLMAAAGLLLGLPLPAWVRRQRREQN